MHKAFLILEPLALIALFLTATRLYFVNLHVLRHVPDPGMRDRARKHIVAAGALMAGICIAAGFYVRMSYVAGS